MNFGGTNEPTDEATADRTVRVNDEPLLSFAAISGRQEQKDQLRDLVITPSTYERHCTNTVLLLSNATHDASNSQLAKALSGELPAGFSSILIDSVGDGIGDEESYVQAALSKAREHTPALVILDCLDEFGFDDEEYELLRQFLDEIQSSNTRVIIACAASDRDSDLVVNDDLFEVTVEVPGPDQQCRTSVLEDQVTTAQERALITLPNAGLDIDAIAEDTAGFTENELRAIVKRAIQRQLNSMDATPVPLQLSHLRGATEAIKAEQLEEEELFFGADADVGTDNQRRTVPDVSFADIGGLRAEKQRLREKVIIPMEHGETFRDAGFEVGQGILLHGPPGCGKTMLAKAVANEMDHHFISVKGPELESPFFGESEERIRDCFGEARENAPSVIFFDEFDALAPSRRSGDVQGPKQDMVNMLLSELDGLEPLDDVIVIAATNRREKLDAAVTRSGRFDTFIEISRPNPEERAEIFGIHTEEIPLAATVSPEWFGQLSLAGGSNEDVSGADIAAICREAFELAVRESTHESTDSFEVTREHFRQAVATSRTSERVVRQSDRQSSIERG